MPPAPAATGSRQLGAALALASLVVITGVDAAESMRFRLINDTVDGGGSHSQGARFALEGTVGQPDTGTASGQRFSVDGGFWAGADPLALPDPIFKNSFED